MPTATTHNPVFALGTVVKYQAFDSSGTLTGTATEFELLRGVSAGTKTRTESDTTGIKDLVMKSRPARKNLGTVTLTLGLTDAPRDTNEWVILNGFWDAGTMIRITIDAPGNFDDAVTTPSAKPEIFSFDGYISSIDTPPFDAKSDDMLEYTCVIKRTPF